MTSDAKVGVLLGFALILIIAFLMNGLPNLLRGDSEEALKSNEAAAASNKNNWGPREQAENVVQKITDLKQMSRSETGRVTPEAIQPAPRAERIDTPIITREVPAEVTLVSVKSEAPKVEIVEFDKVPVKVAYLPVLPGDVLEEVVKGRHGVKRIVPSLPKVKANMYNVADNDNLTKIAVKFYGAKEGNKWSNITKIYQANKDVMGSIDNIPSGKQIIIPPLEEKVVAPEVVSIVPKAKDPEKKKDISKKDSANLYVVENNDSVWKIAEKKLGSGSRYKEIVKLNKSLQKDENRIYVGMKLVMPK